MSDWNPRFVAYARAHGREPQEQLDHDKADMPGGCMFNFIQWNRARLVEYSKINPSAFMCGGLTDHAAYDAWLNEWAAS